MPKWILQKKYAELTGLSVIAMKFKRRRGQWIEGVHWRRGPDGNVWINTEEVDLWVEQGVRPALCRSKTV